MILRPEEPAGGPWEAWPVARLAEEVAAVAPRVPAVVAVDGRGASGKSTLADRLATLLPGAAVVHTDDVAWHHSFFGWADLMLTGVLEPALAGRPVAFRPAAWEDRGRPGTIEVPGGTRFLILEGAGASRRELDAVLSFRIWVQSDFFEAERRGIERDVAQGVNGDEHQSLAFWHRWMAEEIPFFATDRPWERAELVVNGSAARGRQGSVLVSAPPR